MTMYCPVCRAQNEDEVQTCQKCGFDFSSPGNHHNQMRSSISKFITMDIFNVTATIAVVVSLMVIIFGYFLASFLIPMLVPAQPWVLAIQKGDDETKLFALDWKTGHALEFGTSEDNWEPTIHLAVSDPLTAGTLLHNPTGYWNGGAAVLLPESERVIFTVKQDDRWQVNQVDLKTRTVSILVESLDAEPFISVAPSHNLTAISLPATEDNKASLSIFLSTNKLNVPHLLGDTLFTKGILSPNGQYLLYTTTVSQTDATTNAQDIYHTSLYLTRINDGFENTIHEFNHSSRYVPDHYSYDFSPDSQSIIFETAQMEVFVADIQGQVATAIFTPTENTELVSWNITPGSDHLVILVVGQAKNQVELIQVALRTDEIIPFEENLPVSYLTSLTFIDSDKLLYLSPSNNPVIYNFSTHTQSILPLSARHTSSPLSTRDKELIAFMETGNRQTRFNFFNILQNDSAPALNFLVNESVEGLDFANHYVIYQDVNTLYAKDILNNHQPDTIATSNNGYFLTYFPSNSNYLLYTAEKNKQVNIYRVDLRNKQSKLLLENAELLE